MANFIYRPRERVKSVGGLMYYANKAEKVKPTKKNWKELEKDEEVFDRKYE